MIAGIQPNNAALSTFCLVGGEFHRLIEVHDDGTARIEPLTGSDDGGTGHEPPGHEVIAVERIERVLTRGEEPSEPTSRFPQPAGFGEPQIPTVQTDATAGLAEVVQRLAPEGWDEVALDCAALGTRVELTATVSTERGASWWASPPEVVEWLRRSRLVTYRPALGAWTTARFRLARGGEPTLERGYAEPKWEYAPADPRDHHDELRYLPRTQAEPWLLERALEHQESRSVTPRPGAIRMAEVFDGRDGEQRPVAYRPVLTRAEKALVFDYLVAGHPVLSAQSTAEDELDPTLPPDVPKQFRTDGVWVWPLSIAYYLDTHNITPARDLLDHIRDSGYRMARTIADHALAQAKSLVLGAAPESLEPVSSADIVDMVRNLIANLHVSRRFYSFEVPVDYGWSMLRDPDGWWAVFCLDQDGRRKNETRFPDAMSAGAHLLGCLTLSRGDLQRDADEVLEDYECPLRPVPIDPPLATYDDKRVTDLVPGDELDRFGSPEGNTVFVGGTTLPQRSAPRGTPPGEYHRYRVLAVFQAVTGSAKPDHGQVGGGIAYVLPSTVSALVEMGWIVEV